MKSKILLTLFLTAFLLSLSLASAEIQYSVSTPAVLTQSSSRATTTFTITNSYTFPINITLPASITFDDGTSNFRATLNTTSINNLASGSPATVSVTRDNDVPLTFKTGVFFSPLNITAVNASDGANSTSKTITLTFVKSICEKGSSTNTTRYLEITSIKDKTSDKDWEWKPLDEVEVEVKVKFVNTADKDDSIDAVVELGVYDTKDNDFIDLGSDDILEEDISLDEGDSETVKFLLKVPSDIEGSSSRYKLVVKAYEDGEEDTVCRDYKGSGVSSSDYFLDIDLKKEAYNVVLDNIVSPEEEVLCGQEVTINAEAWNIGTHDEDQVEVNLYNKELGININSETFSLDVGDEKDVDFTFSVPKNATEKTYTLELRTYFRYSESSDSYREKSDAYTVPLMVKGSCSGSQKLNASLNASLSDETPKPRVGGQVIIEAKITNTGTNTTTYTIDVTGNSAWSQATIDPKTVTLIPGESETVKIYLDISKDAEAGTKEFTIKASYGTQATEQRVKLTLEKGFTTQAIVEHVKKNWFIYVIVLVNLIIIIAIIVVIAKMVSARKAAA